ncbi:hypothetical protein B0H14DRAFT_2606843 [Mycena olivaceomarginata]|nr:hypothetical protein B0H14DRAFT_2606843 [Mycena olivaceomarginata]
MTKKQRASVQSSDNGMRNTRVHQQETNAQETRCGMTSSIIPPILPIERLSQHPALQLRHVGRDHDLQVGDLEKPRRCMSVVEHRHSPNAVVDRGSGLSRAHGRHEDRRAGRRGSIGAEGSTVCDDAPPALAGMHCGGELLAGQDVDAGRHVEVERLLSLLVGEAAKGEPAGIGRMRMVGSSAAGAGAAVDADGVTPECAAYAGMGSGRCAGTSGSRGIGIVGRVEREVDRLKGGALALVVGGALHAPPRVTLAPFFEALVLGIREAIRLIARDPPAAL